MEQDNEVSGSGNSYDYGFRIYNPRLGKFLSVDPLFGDYPSTSLYAYVLNNPVILMDADGRKVKPMSPEALEAMKMGLSPEEAKYVELNRKGFIKKSKLKKGVRKMDEVGGNYSAVLELVSDKIIVEVYTTKIIKSLNLDGTRAPNQEFQNVPRVNLREDAWKKFKKSYEGKSVPSYRKWVKLEGFRYSDKTVYPGLLGQTVLPEGADQLSSSTRKSINGNVQVYINPFIGEEQQAVTGAHEAYGHALFFIRKEDPSHRDLPGAIGTDKSNDPLEIQIKAREKEAKKNYRKHKRLKK
jgi:RHS repeat-associated protein